MSKASKKSIAFLKDRFEEIRKNQQNKVIRTDRAKSCLSFVRNGILFMMNIGEITPEECSGTIKELERLFQEFTEKEH